MKIPNPWSKITGDRDESQSKRRRVQRMEPQGTPGVQTVGEEGPGKGLEERELGEAWRQDELIRRTKEGAGHQGGEDHVYRVLWANRLGC